jgi:hypothetical protein
MFQLMNKEEFFAHTLLHMERVKLSEEEKQYVLEVAWHAYQEGYRDGVGGMHEAK